MSLTLVDSTSRKTTLDPAHSVAASTCTHCALEVPSGLVVPNADQQFCCSGCEAAYTMIHAGGLDRFYELRRQAEANPGRVAESSRGFAEFDHDTFQSLYCKACAGSLRTTELLLEGVHCAACVWLLEKLPSLVPGVIDARLNLRRATLQLVWDADTVRLSEVARTLATLGYTPHPARGVKAREIRKLDDRKALIRIAVAGACAGNVMLLFVALYAGLFEGMEAGHMQLLRWSSMLLSAIAIMGPGGVFFRGAWSSLRARTLTLDVPIALGFGAGLVWGIANTFRGTGDLYFDSLSALVFFLLVGRFVQSRQQRLAADSVELLFSLTPATARLVKTDSISDVPVETLIADDIVEVRSGDAIPVDGTVIDGQAAIDRSVLTGESRAVPTKPGDIVFAGTISLTGRLLIRVESTGEATRVGKLMRLVEDGARSKGPMVALADRFAIWFVFGLLFLAAVTAAIWWSTSPQRAIDHAVALLIATCPCGLGLATPLAMAVATGRAAGRGILIKSGEAIERLGRHGAGTLFLDKTGTITQGRPSLVGWSGQTDQEIELCAFAIASGSSHHAARAIAKGLGSKLTPDQPTLATDLKELPGKGLTASVDGRRVMLGSPSWVRSHCQSENPAIAIGECEALARNATPVLLAVDGRIVSLAMIGDAIRPDALASIIALREAGWRVRLLSGDHPHLVQQVGASLGMDPADCLGGQSPEDKLSAVTQALATGSVIMVGDGVNDGPALAAATVGIAVHGGAEASLAAAHVYTARDGLAPLLEIINGSRRTVNVIKWSIAVSLAYNFVVAGLAMAGYMSPLAAAILMPAASLSVLTLCVRGRSFDRPEPRSADQAPHLSPLPSSLTQASTL